MLLPEAQEVDSITFASSHFPGWPTEMQRDKDGDLPRWPGNLGRDLPAKAGATGDVGSVPGSERSPGGGHGNPLQFSCLKNPMDRAAWQATVYRVSQSWT